MNVEEMLGIDPDDPEQRLARWLVEQDEKLMDSLIQVRQWRGLTRADVAEKLGCAEADVARIEQGERDPHLSTLRRYAFACGARVEHTVRPFER